MNILLQAQCSALLHALQLAIIAHNFPHPLSRYSLHNSVFIGREVPSMGLDLKHAYGQPSLMQVCGEQTHILACEIGSFKHKTDHLIMHCHAGF